MSTTNQFLNSKKYPSQFEESNLARNSDTEKNRYRYMNTIISTFQELASKDSNKKVKKKKGKEKKRELRGWGKEIERDGQKYS